LAKKRFPLIERPTPLIDFLKERPTVVLKEPIFKRLGSSPEWLDTRFEEARRAKVEEWRKKGAPERLITRALMYAEEYSRGMARALEVDPALVYRKALDFADEWVQGIIRAMFV